jgi:hypothetical protein
MWWYLIRNYKYLNLGDPTASSRIACDVAVAANGHGVLSGRLLAFLTFPLVLLSWFAMAIDRFLPEFGCYTGALIFGQVKD